MSTEHKVSKDDVERLYNEVRFEVMSEGFEYVDKQILEPKPTCVFCPGKVQDDKTIIRGVRFNDHSSKTQTIFSACVECCEQIKNLKDQDIELDRTQRIVRLLFPKSGDKMINHMFGAKRLNNYPPIYLEYMGALKWTVEEKMLRQLMEGLPVNQTDRYTEVIPKDGEDGQASDTVDMYSPIKECWMGIHFSHELAKQVKLDLQGVEYEIRTTYWDDYKDYDDKPKRVALEQLCRGTVGNKNRVFFIDTCVKEEQVHEILSILGCDENHSIIQKFTETVEEKAEETVDSDRDEKTALICSNDEDKSPQSEKTALLNEKVLE